MKSIFLSFLVLVSCLQVSGKTNAQGITLSEKNVSLEKVLKEIKKQTGYDIWYENKLLKNTRNISIDVENATVEQVLDFCFRNESITWSIVGKVIVLKAKNDPAPLSSPPLTVRGKITNEKGEPMTGVSIEIKGLKTGTSSNSEGVFEITVPDENSILIISSVGYTTQEIKVSNRQNIAVKLAL